MSMIDIDYQKVESCPLCGSTDCIRRGKVARSFYSFGAQDILMPKQGVSLLECKKCGLVYKDCIPTSAGLSQILSAGATDVWQHSGRGHPLQEKLSALASNGSDGVLDIGASNGEVLEALQDTVSRRSALDIVRYKQCENIISDEYILGQFEAPVAWSGKPYSLVTAFDVFEHFMDAKIAVNKICDFLTHRGLLVIETGDHEGSYPAIGRWYYSNLFEHQIFWNRKSIGYLAQSQGMEIVTFEKVNHKGRLNMKAIKWHMLEVAHWFGRWSPTKAMVKRFTDVDVSLLSRPHATDHMFVVLRKV